MAQPHPRVGIDALARAPAGGEHLAGDRILDPLVRHVHPEERHLDRDAAAIIARAYLLAPPPHRIE